MNNQTEAQINMPQYRPSEIEEIKKCFALYVKFPKNRWKEIERAEKNDEEGNKIYSNLKKEFLEKYMPKPDADPHGGLVEDMPDEDPNCTLSVNNVQSPHSHEHNKDEMR